MNRIILSIVMTFCTLVSFTAVAAGELQKLAEENAALKKLIPFSEGEQALFTAAESGNVAELDQKRRGVVRAPCLAWLFADPKAAEKVTPRGIQITGMDIEGKLDIRYVQVTFPLFIRDCNLSSIQARGAKLREIEFSGGQITGGIDAEGLQTEGDITFKDGFKAFGEVKFSGATVGKNIYCSKACFHNAEGRALDFDAANIKGSVVVENSRIEGEVIFIRARIGGQMICSATTLSKNSPGSCIAIAADSSRIDGPVILGPDFQAEGNVLFQWATIGGDFRAYGATFIGPPPGAGQSGQAALSLLGTTVSGSVMLVNSQTEKSRPCESIGVIELYLATIGGNLDCRNAKLYSYAPNTILLNAEGSKISGSAILAGSFSAMGGGVRFTGTHIGRDLDCKGGNIANPAPNGDALECRGITVVGNVHLEDKFTATGRISFEAADMGLHFYLRRAKTAGVTELDLRDGKVQSLGDDDKDSWPDNIKLAGFAYDRLDDNGGENKTLATRKEWIIKDPSHNPQTYDRLSTVFQNMGYEHAAREVMIEKNRMLAREPDAVIEFRGKWWWYHLFGPVISFGYEPWRAVWWSLGFIGVGFIVFRWADSRNIMVPSNDDAYEPKTDANLPPKLVDRYPKYSWFIYSIESFFPLVNLHQSENWMPATRRFGIKKRIGKKDKVIYYDTLVLCYLRLHIAAGWILTSLLVSALTGLAKT